MLPITKQNNAFFYPQIIEQSVAIDHLYVDDYGSQIPDGLSADSDEAVVKLGGLPADRSGGKFFDRKDPCGGTITRP